MSIEDFTRLGQREIWGGTIPFGLSRAERRQHLYVFGKSGTGKTTLLRNLIVQDIDAGHGCAVIDPHGDLAEELLDLIPPWRTDHVVYFNPSDFDHPFGFNLLADVPRDSRHAVAAGIVGAFKALWIDSWGPRLEFWLYNCVASLLECKNVTLLGVPRMLVDEEYRRWVVKQICDPMLLSFWRDEFENYDDRFRSEAISPILNKVSRLLVVPAIRNVLGQVQNRFDARFMMDKAEIVQRGNLLDVPFHLTWSCYEGGTRHCGACGTCVERREAFQLAKVDDPTEYDESAPSLSISNALPVDQQAYLLRRIGYGIPSIERATTNTDHRTTFITQSECEIAAGDCHVYQVPIPEELRRPGDDYDIRIEVTLSYVAEPRRTRRRTRGYLSTWLDWVTCRKGEQLTTFLNRALKTEEDAVQQGSSFAWGIGTTGANGRLPGVRRGVGTVQKDWTTVKSNELPPDFCIAVRGHRGWSRDPEAVATYALAVSIEIVGKEIPIYEPLRTAVLELQSEVEVETEVQVNIEE